MAGEFLQGAAHTLDPTGVLKPTTLVHSQLHQMHLMHPTWFSAAHHRWRKTSGEHSTTISVLLKRFLGSKDYRLPIAPPRTFQCCFRGWARLLLPGDGDMRLWSDRSGMASCFRYPCSWLTLGWDLLVHKQPHAPGRLCSLQVRAVGDTTRHGDVVIDRGHIDPVRNGDAFETLGYYDHFDRRGKDTVKCCDILS